MTPRNPQTDGSGPAAIAADERDLLLRHRAGDREAFGRLVASYRRPVYSYLVRCGVADADRDDVFQDIFIKIHGSADRYEGDRPLHPWLFTIVANTVRTYHRKRKVTQMVFAEPSEREPSGPSPDGERQVMSKQAAAWLEHEIARMPFPQREVLLLSAVENLPGKDVAAALGLPVNTVKTHLRRARMALAQKLIRRKAIRRGEVPS